jgi:hypothetical protein
MRLVIHKIDFIISAGHLDRPHTINDVDIDYCNRNDFCERRDCCKRHVCTSARFRANHLSDECRRHFRTHRSVRD